MPNKAKYDRIYRDPTSGLSLEDILAKYETFNIKCPYNTIEVPASWIIDPKLTEREKIILILMHAYSNKNDEITITTRQLQVYIHADRSSCRRTIQKLISNGYVTRIDGINGARPTYRIADPTPKVRKSRKKIKNEDAKIKSRPKNRTGVGWP